MDSYLHVTLFKYLEISGFSGVITELWHHFNTTLFSYDLCGSYIILKSKLFQRNHFLLHSAAKSSTGTKEERNSWVKMCQVLSHLHSLLLLALPWPCSWLPAEKMAMKDRIRFHCNKRALRIPLSTLEQLAFRMGRGMEAFTNHQHYLSIFSWIIKMEFLVSRLLSLSFFKNFF